MAIRPYDHGVALLLAMGAVGCFTDDDVGDARVGAEGGVGSMDASALGDAQARLDGSAFDLPDGASDGSASDSGLGATQCPLMGQLYRVATDHCECPVRIPDECPGACVNLRDDAEHCGDCETACEPGAGCSAGECMPPPTEVATLAGCMNPRMILSDGVFYFSDTGTGTISSLPVAGNAAAGVVTEIVTGQTLENPERTMWTSALAVDADSIYWSNMGNGTIMKGALSGADPSALIELDAPVRGLAVGGGMVFFTHHADVFKIPSSGLPADAGAGVPPAEIDCGELPNPPQIGEPVPGATYVASSNDSCVPGGEVSGIAVNDAELAYAVDGHGALHQNSQNGGAHFPLVSMDDLGPARDLVAINDTHAFAAGYSSVLKATLGEHRVVEAVVNAVDLGLVTGFTVTDTHVYVASDRGGISRAPIIPPSGTPLVSDQIARDQLEPRWLVHDGTKLYWIGSDCTIHALELPP